MIIKEPCVVDISHYDPLNGEPLDPRILGVFMKASQGKSYKDPTCKANFERSAGRKRGLFHFFETDPYDSHVSLQIDNFMDVATTAGAFLNGAWLAEYEPCLDVEYDPGQFGLHGEALQKQVKIQLDEMEIRTTFIPIIYTSKRFWKYLMTNLMWMPYLVDGVEYWDWFPTGASKFPSWTSRYKLWVAQYPLPQYVDDHNAPAYLPDGWLEWWLWQYSDKGKMAGSNEYIDLNLLNDKEPEPPEEHMYKITVTWSAGATKRAQPYYPATPTGGILPLGSVVFSDKEQVLDAYGNKWIELTDGWLIATVYGGAPRVTIVPVVEPPIDGTISTTLVFDDTGETYKGTLTKV